METKGWFWVGQLVLCLGLGFGLFACRTAPPPTSSLPSRPGYSYRPAIPLHLVLCVNAHFHGKSGLEPWEHSLEAVRLLAQSEWNVPAHCIHRLQNRSAREFLAWWADLQSSIPKGETLLVYFATHQLSDGTLYFAEGPPLKGAEWVAAINRLGEHHRVILLNDSCFAEKLESCGKFSSQVIRLHACGTGESSLEVKFEEGSPEALEFVRPEREFLETRLQTPVASASFLGVLWLRAARDLMAAGRETISWKEMVEEMEFLRNRYAEETLQPHLQHLKIYSAENDFTLLRRS